LLGCLITLVQVGFGLWIFTKLALGWVGFDPGWLLAFCWVGLAQVDLWAELAFGWIGFHWVDFWPDWHFSGWLLTGLLNLEAGLILGPGGFGLALGWVGFLVGQILCLVGFEPV